MPPLQVQVTLLLVIAGLVTYVFNIHHEIADLRISTREAATAETLLESTGTTLNDHKPFVPMRPGNSLTPEYYRGNDERSPRLFNGGFYRTATFRLATVL